MNKELVVIFSVVLVGAAIAFATTYFLQPVIKPHFVAISNWPIYKDSHHGVAFQYPAGWTVTRENWMRGQALRISPPDAEYRDYEGESDYPYSIYGIRVAPFGTYPALPSTLTEEDIWRPLDAVNYFIRSAEFKMDTGERVMLLYDTGHDDRSLAAFKMVGTTLFQIEMGRKFAGNTLSDIVAFFGVIATLRDITDLQATAPAR